MMLTMDQAAEAYGSQQEPVQLAQNELYLASSVNTSFILSSAYLVFVMQAGFALVCAAHIRKKSNANVLLCNAADTMVVTVVYYLVGFGIGFGVGPGGSSNGFIGTGGFALNDVTDASRGEHSYEFFMFQWAFACAATTITAGAVAERMSFPVYLGYATLMPAWVYPMLTHWAWSARGWLSASNPDPLWGSGAIDFAGSGVVHLTGGTCSLLGILFVGPRIGRFDAEGKPSDEFRSLSVTHMFLGTVLLWFGWFGFNPGSAGLIAYGPVSAGIVARTAVCTTLAGGTSGLAALFTSFAVFKYWDVSQLCNGVLAGTVAVTAGCGVIEPWAAMLLGLLSGPLVMASEWWLIRLRVDDVVAAVPTHLCCGLLGTLWVGFFATKQYVLEFYGPDPNGSARWGVLWGGNGALLACQVVEALVIAAWVTVFVGAYFWAMHKLKWIRVPLEQELAGLDASKYNVLTTNSMPSTLAVAHSGGHWRNRVD